MAGHTVEVLAKKWRDIEKILYRSYIWSYVC